MKPYEDMTRADLCAEAQRLLDAMPPGTWVHNRYRNENGWWSALVQERADVPVIDTVIRLLVTQTPDQERGGDVVEFVVRAKRLLPLLIRDAPTPFTRTLPTAPGWYWVRWRAEGEEKVIAEEVTGSEGRLRMGGLPLAGWTECEWCGPLEVPQ